jgi:hypothetical protein
VNGSGSITAHFHPLAQLYLYTTPTTCGSIEVNGLSYPDGAQLTLPAPNSYSVNSTPCAHYGFLYWLTSSGISVANGSLLMESAARLTAVFGPLTYQIQLNVAPGECGGVKVGSNLYVNNTSLGEPYGNYTIAPTPCSGFHLVSWDVSGNVTIKPLASGHYLLTVTGTGKVLGLYRPVPPVVTIACPSSAAVGTSVSCTVVVGTLVPPYNYTYVWSWGDGSPTTTTAANFTSHTYGSLGTYQVQVTVHDPYGRVADANQTVSVLSSPPGSNTSLTLTAVLAIVIGVLAVLAAVLLALRGRAPPPPDERSTAIAQTEPETNPESETKSIRSTEP